MNEQGVAQQAIKRAKADNLLRPRDRDFLMMGMELMQQGLSAEARQVLAEIDQSVQQDGYDFWHVEIKTLRTAFMRLGLDLNEPENGDE